ncbi:MAG: AMP-binding protein [Pseudomonadota bacterium]
MTRPWLAHYPTGVSTEEPSIEYASIGDMLEAGCRRNGAKTAVECLGASYTFTELEEKAEDFGSYLQQIGLKRGDRVAVMMPNIGQFGIATFGILRAGFVSVNVNPLYTARELRHQLIDSGAKAIVLVENFAATLEEVLHETEVEHVIVAKLGDMLPPVKRALVNLAVKHVKKMVPPFKLPQAVSFRQALKAGALKPMTRVEVGPDDVAFIQYTGGTTGVAKGATLLHRNVMANVAQSEAYNSIAWPGGGRVVMPLPLYHIFALAFSMLATSKGYTQLLIPNPRDMKGFVKTLKGKPFFMMPGVNTLFAGLMNTPGFSDLDFSELSLTFGGGTATLKATSDQWQEVTGKPILEGYGLSETSPVLTGNHASTTEFTGTVGMPVPGTDISLRNEEGHEVGPGEPGEICAKGPQVFPGYWNRPEATAEAFTPDGYFKTGDIAVLDEKGRLKIVDRKKDMIIVSGFNVYPTEIEGIIAELPGVLECAVIGVPSEKTGEAPKAFIIAKDPDLSEADLKAHCRANLTAYKQPKVYEFVDELPKSPVGKVLRKELRAIEEGKAR